MRALLGQQADDFLSALAGTPVAGLRVNTLKISVGQFRSRSPWPLEPIPWCPSGFTLVDEARPGRHPYHAAGLYYLQEPTAMAVTEALAPRPGEWVLDLAAAPGGKSTHIVSLMRDSGLLVANELEARRAGALVQNLERWGTRSALVTNAEPEALARRWGGMFDRVLLDAPCSGEGMFRKSEAACEAWSVEHVRGCALRQANALASAACMVRPGGWLAYSTCTFAPEENEAVIARFLGGHRDFALAPVSLAGADPGRPEWLPDGAHAALTGSIRFWPHRVRGEGHFVALLRREQGETPVREPARSSSAPRRVQRLWQSFAADTLESDPAAGAFLILSGDRLHALPADLPALEPIRTVHAGLWLGTLRGDRIQPSHSLALSLRPDEIGARLPRVDFEPDDGRVLRYLKGHPFDEAGPDGWVLVGVSGSALGWGRRTRGVVKNHYPRGLRWTDR